MYFIEKKGLLFMKQGSKIGIVCCSNGLRPEQAETIKMLVQILEKSGLEVDLSPYLYGDENGQAGTARDRAGALMKFYEDDSVTDIFDVSGGDMANEILSYLDFQTIAYEKKHFWGYSDLTTIINAIYARTGKSSVLYQIRNLTYDHSQSQITDFLNTTLAGSSSLYDFPYEFVQGTHMEGIVVGGNIRCLLKLAGTPYWPDMREKMEADNCQPDMAKLLLEFTEKKTPIAKTPLIGHGTDSKAIRIGHRLKLFSAEENKRIYKEF